jgi:phytoene dehydrogenase-like protein
MQENYDIVTIGSGHNGLVAAAYLAAAGKKVLVVERQPWFGGGVITRELTRPGFKHDQHSMAHIFIQANPLIKDDELGLLAKYGLKYIYPEIPLMSVFPDGTTLALYTDRDKNYAEISRFSKRDAESYLKLSELGATYLPAIVSGLFNLPAPTGAMYAFMDSSREGRLMMSIMQKSAYEIVKEYFTDDRVLLHFTRMVSENLTGPEEKGTGIGLFVFLAFLEKYGIGVAEGGSGQLSMALIRCIEDHGGKVEANVSVSKVLTSKGRATGITTDDGRTIMARDAVIGAIHPHDIGRFIDGVEPEIVEAAARTQLSENCVFTIHAALDSPLQFKAGDKPRSAMMIELLPNDINVLRGHFDDLRYGRLPKDSLIGLGSVSNLDPTRAPPGKATMHAWDYVPYEHPQGGAKHWDVCKKEFAEHMLGKMGEYITNLTPANILDYHCDSPLDMERHSASFRKGDIHGIAFNMVQSGAHRPTPELGQNTVPGVERFYLVGPFQHPGGGVFGAGRATAMKMFDDLGLSVDKLN